MDTRELDYDLPAELIAQQPLARRDASRLLVLRRADGHIEHTRFGRIGDYFRAGDCLVRNDTRVIPARFFCRRKTGGRIEALFLRQQDQLWHVLLRPSARLRVGESLRVEVSPSEEPVWIELVERGERGAWVARVRPSRPALDLLTRIGQTPLPPYVRRAGGPDAADAQRYQTVYAQTPGAVAAPTAGLHFTPELLEALAHAGIRIADVTLHVGLGTFAPIVAETLESHPMHAEWYCVSAEAAKRLSKYACSPAPDGSQLVAVGTTSARVLESLPPGPIRACEGWTDLFIYPPYAFKRVGALLTNFHLPGSTLLALVMAFAGVDHARRAYREAVERRYRFYSYGDAMLIV